LVKSLGLDVKVVQELLLHACFGTTMNLYTQALEQQKQQALAQLSSVHGSRVRPKSAFGCAISTEKTRIA
jgi:hypothetical protein